MTAEETLNLTFAALADPTRRAILAHLAKGNASVRPGRYTFSVLDTQSGMTYSWTSATGLSQLARKDSGVVKTLKLGFDFSANQAGPQWSADFKRSPGSCYWIMALLHN